MNPIESTLYYKMICTMRFGVWLMRQKLMFDTLINSQLQYFELREFKDEGVAFTVE